MLLKDSYNVNKISSIIKFRDNPLVINLAVIRKIYIIDLSNRE